MTEQQNDFATADDYGFLYDLPRVDFCAESLHYVPYVQYGRQHPRQYLDLIFKDSAKNKPIVLWIHGGSWRDEYLTLTYRPERALAELAQKGYLVACVEYRLSQHAVFPACVDDCQLAVKYLKQNATRWQADAAHVAVWGESAGAYLACMLGTNYNEDKAAAVQAAVSWYAPSNLSAESREQGDGSLNGDRNMVSLLLGCSAAKNPDQARRASPLHYADKKAPPFLLMHGEIDDLVSFHQSKDMRDALVRAGNDAVLVAVPGQGHGFFQGEQWYQAVYNFLDETLKKGNA